jgi:hypothetical protein
MDKNMQQEITLACIPLLQQNAADEEKARISNGLPAERETSIFMEDCHIL